AGRKEVRQAERKTRRHEDHKEGSWNSRLLSHSSSCPSCLRVYQTSLSDIGPHPSISCVGALAALAQVFVFKPAQRVGGKRLSLGSDIDAVNLRRVQAKDFGLVLLGQLLVAELLAQLVGNLKTLEG